MLGGVLRFLIPVRQFHQLLYKPMHAVYALWAQCNFVIMNMCNKIDWQITGNFELNKSSWYLIIANHQSWLDIFVLSAFTSKHTSTGKYFLKDSLKHIPFLGMACKTLDMPFMKRYSQEFLKKNPHLKGTDIESTRKSCQSFKENPTAIINFVEGTRFTRQKKQHTQSPFNNLLPPKAGGIAFTLAALGEQFDKIINISIVYPDNPGHIMKDMLAGKLTSIVIDVELIDITPDLIGDYFGDTTFKNHFQQWLNGIWQQKDYKIAKINASQITVMSQNPIENFSKTR